jgi:GT2 family glycosyltransferase
MGERCQRSLPPYNKLMTIATPARKADHRVRSKVGIVLLNWNGWEDTCVCLTSLRRLQYPDFEMIVVDNGSTDNSPAHIRRMFPEARIIEAGKNLGFAGGCNWGIRHALGHGCDFAWLLNNDTTVDPQALQALVDKADADPDLGAVGSAIYFMDDTRRLQAWGGGYINFWLGRSRHFLRPAPDDSIDFITGASMLITRSAVESIGLLDESFFMYWEDADYCFRLREAGWKIGVAGESRILHKGSASVGKGSAKLDRYFNASAVRFFNKHARTPAIPRWTGVTLRIGKRVMARDWERARAVWAGISQV